MKRYKNEQPITLIKAIHNCWEALAASSDEAEDLSAELCLCKGARRIVKRNLWVAKSLTNGSVGIITDPIYDTSIEYEVCSECMLLCILVQFEKYPGPPIYGGSIPFVAIMSSFKKYEE